MKNITNAYLVLSVADIRAMLHAAELEQKVRCEVHETVCIVLKNIEISFDEGDKPQISSWSIVAAADKLVAESNEDLNIRDANPTPMNHSDAAI